MKWLNKACVALSTVAATPNPLSWPIWRGGSWSSALLVSRLAQDLERPPRTIIDIGANVGQFSREALRTWPGAQVYAFEPGPEAYAEIKRRLAKDEICIKPAVVGSKTGFATFNICRSSQNSSVLTPLSGDRGFVTADVVSVPETTLDMEFADGRLARPVLVKIDVQGGEKNVILGGHEFFSREVDYVVCEVSFAPMYAGQPLFSEIHELFLSNGFELRSQLAYLHASLGSSVTQADFLYVSRFVGSCK